MCLGTRIAERQKRECGPCRAWKTPYIFRIANRKLDTIGEVVSGSESARYGEKFKSQGLTRIFGKLAERGKRAEISRFGKKKGGFLQRVPHVSPLLRDVGLFPVHCRSRNTLFASHRPVFPSGITLLPCLPTSSATTVQAICTSSHPVVTSGAPHHIWQPRFYDFNVWTERKRIEKLRYIHRNPVKRGLVASPEQWRWSSFRWYCSGEAGPVRTNDTELLVMKVRPAAS